SSGRTKCNSVAYGIQHSGPVILSSHRTLRLHGCSAFPLTRGHGTAYEVSLVCVRRSLRSSSPITLSSRPIKLLLLACFGFWVTGAAHFLHERLDHDHSATGSASSDRPGTSWTLADDDGHDESLGCLCCSMLATMSVSRSMPPALVASHSPPIT